MSNKINFHNQYGPYGIDTGELIYYSEKTSINKKGHFHRKKFKMTISARNDYFENGQYDRKSPFR